MTVSDVYKKYIMVDPSYESDDHGIEVFQNNNVLKYSNKTGIPSQ